MAILLGVYAFYLLLYGLASYAIIYHLTKYRIKGDKSTAALYIYVMTSITVIIGSILLLRPI
jgi:hypothetical protein